MPARLIAAALLFASAGQATPPAGNSLPGWAPPITAEVAPRDADYPGTLTLDVDARTPGQGIFHVRQSIPVANAGRLTLRYPQWLQASHGPTGQIGAVAGLRIMAGSRTLVWQRDRADMFALHVDVPAGAERIDLTFDYLAPVGGATGRTMATPDMLNLQWEKTAFYPAGHFVRRIAIRPSVTLPDGWTGVSALDGMPRKGRISYPTTDFETMVDSPLFAGRHFKAWTLRPGVDLNVVADRAEDLAATPEQIETHGRIVDQAVKLFGARHYDRYDFLLAASDSLWKGGIEHHRSSENGVPRGYFTDWATTGSVRGLLPHEFVHSWNGKFRRPATAWRPDYHEPIDNELLWVYEGQTSFWDIILGVRSGVVPKEIGLGELASTAAGYAVQAGRAWRPLADTVNQPIIAYGATQPFASQQRGADYYNESALIWLEADMLIREKSRGRRSLDDFARAFFGMRDGDWGVSTYRFEDVVAALDAVERHDWAGFLRTRIDRPGAPAPIAGIERGGYRIVWKDTPNPFDTASMKVNRRLDLTHSLGATIGREGVVSAVAWDGPLFRQGLNNGTTLVAVDGRSYADDELKAAIAAAKGGREPIRLLIKEGGRYREIAVDYHGGLRWPHLERAGKSEAPLDKALAPL